MKIIQGTTNRSRKTTYYREYRFKNAYKFSNYGIVAKMLVWIGMDINGTSYKKRYISECVTKFIFPVLLHLAYVDYLMMCYANLKHKWQEYQVVISYIISNSLSLTLWYVLYVRKKNIKALLEKLGKVHDQLIYVKPLEKWLFNALIVIVIIILPFLYSVTSVGLMLDNDRSHYYTFFTYGITVANFTLAVKFFLFAKTFSSLLLDPILTTVITVFYSSLCFRCYRLLSLTYRKLKKVYASNSAPPDHVLLQIARDFSKTLKILDQLQSVFSLPTFLLIFVDASSSFTTLASVLLYSLEERTAAVTIENTFVFVYSAGLLIATIAFAAQVPITMSRIRDICHQLHIKYEWNNDNSGTRVSRILPFKIIQERHEFVLSGCDIIYFRRSSVLTALGTLFTYGLLVIQMR